MTVTVGVRTKGGAGSGNWGHAGRPGLRGGSSARSSLAHQMWSQFMQKRTPRSYEFGTGEGQEVTSQKPYRRINDHLNGAVDDIYPSSYGDEHITRDKMNWRRLKNTRDDLILRGAVKNGIVRQLVKDVGLDPDNKADYEKVNAFIKQWSYSANDSDMRSLSIQQAASKEFGVPLSEWQQGQIKATMSQSTLLHPDSTKPLPGMDQPLQRKLLAAMYNQTQQAFAEQGIGPDDTIRVVRATSWASMTTSSGQQIGELIPSSGVAKLMGETLSYTGNAIESWSVGRSGANPFAGYGNVVIEMHVPARNVLATARTGFGALHEGEVVLIGGVPNQTVRVVSSPTTGLTAD